MRKLLILGALFAFAMTLAAVAELRTVNARASSHREAPSISQDPAADNTDTYMFASPDMKNTVTLVANYYPYEGAAGGPNFYRFGDDVRYELHIDNNGDALDDMTLIFRFHTTINNPNTFLYNTGPLNDPPTYASWTIRQTYTITLVANGKTTVIAKDLETPPSNVGCHSIPAPGTGSCPGGPGYSPITAASVYTVDKDIKVFAGQRADPFFADVGSIFDLLTIRGGVPGGFESGGANTFTGYNLQTIALQVPIQKLTHCHCIPQPGDFDNDVVGFWASASRQGVHVSDSRASWVQVSRLGLPLTNEVIIPMSMKDKFNATQPVNDVQNFAGPVETPELAQLFHDLYGLSIPPTPRTDLVDNLLTGIKGLNQPNNVVASDMLRLNVTTPLCGGSNPPCSRFGVIDGDPQGFPNGRRLTDDVVDASERVVAGVLNTDCQQPPCSWQQFPNNAMGDGVNQPNVPPMATFPYVPDPYDGFDYPSQ